MMAEVIDTAVRADIENRLTSIERDHGVEIILAVESGSRAWGFSSPDSDYDIRFVYRREMADYARLFPHRDVIETPIEDLIDLNGWDLAKALRLLLKSNAVVSEWLESPIVYRRNDSVAGQLERFADRCLRAESMVWHYLSLGKRQWETYLADEKEVPAKKYFYALRPALTLRHLRMFDGRPPMDIDKLIAACEISSEQERAIAAMREAKRNVEEKGLISRDAVMDKLIVSEIEIASSSASKAPRIRDEDVEAAEALFQALVS